MFAVLSFECHCLCFAFFKVFVSQNLLFIIIFINYNLLQHIYHDSSSHFLLDYLPILLMVTDNVTGMTEHKVYWLLPGVYQI